MITTAAAKAATVTVMRANGHWMRAAEIAQHVGCAHAKLTGDSAAVLFLLEAEGLVERTGRNRGTRWRAVA